MKISQVKRKALLLSLLLILLVCLGGCQSDNDVNSSRVSSQESSQASSEASSSQPESQESQASEPVSSEISTPDNSEGFEALFSQNPIDLKFDSDMAIASTENRMIQACDAAAKSWQDMIDTSYRAALEAADGEKQAVLQAEQVQWADNLDAEIAKLQEATDDTQAGALETAQQIVQIYRDRVKELCKSVFDDTGSLPEFPVASEDDGTPQG